MATCGKSFLYFSLVIISLLFCAWSKLTSELYELEITRNVASSVHSHAGNIIVAMVLLVVPGGMFMIRSYGFGKRFTIQSASFCNSSHKYSICQLNTGSSGIITDQNVSTNL